jgi:hypothetical protein
MHQIEVESVEEADQAAKQLMRPDRTFWFRGQAKDWPLQSSFVRVKLQDHQFTRENPARSEGWVKHTPGLKSRGPRVDAPNYLSYSGSLPRL